MDVFAKFAGNILQIFQISNQIEVFNTFLIIFDWQSAH